MLCDIKAESVFFIQMYNSFKWLKCELKEMQRIVSNNIELILIICMSVKYGRVAEQQCNICLFLYSTTKYQYLVYNDQREFVICANMHGA